MINGSDIVKPMHGKFCYAQPLNNGVCTALRLPLSATPCHKILRKLGRNKFIAKHKNLLVPQAPELLEKVAESLLYKFQRELILLKLKIKSYCAKLVQKA